MSSLTVRGRLAPSPTGAMHLGNARTYLIAWLDAKSRGGEIILRIEDIDAGRVKPDAIKGLIDDFQWLGITWDGEPILQSSRLLVYQLALDQLKSRELVYPCVCSRADILNASSAPHGDQETIRYPGTCSKFRVRDAKSLAKPYCWRARFQQAIQFQDRLSGVQQYDPQEIGGDFVVWRNDQSPAYQLSVIVDDALMGITDVIRGDDLLSSTPKQCWIANALGLTTPNWFHVPLVLDEQGKRFAKRDGSVQIKELRDSGVRSESIIGWLAWTCGWLEQPRPISLSELLPLYQVERLPRQAITVTAKDLVVLHQLS